MLGDPTLSGLVLPVLMQRESAGGDDGLTFEEFKALCYKAWKVIHTRCVYLCLYVCTCAFLDYLACVYSMFQGLQDACIMQRNSRSSTRYYREDTI